MIIELHAHTAEGSPCAQVPAGQVVREYHKKGFDALVITNHFDQTLLDSFGDTGRERMDRYLLGYRRAKEEGDRLGLRVLLGLELRLDCGCEDFLVFGVTPEFVYAHPDLCSLSLPAAHETLRAAGALLIQAHPFRFPCRPQEAAHLDGIEVHNACLDAQNHNDRARRWAAENPRFILTSGSDYHDLGNPSAGGIVTGEDVRDSVELASCLRERRGVTLRTESKGENAV